MGASALDGLHHGRCSRSRRRRRRLVDFVPPAGASIALGMKVGMFPVRQPDATPSKNRPQLFVETVTDTRHVDVEEMVGRTGRSHE